MSNNLLHSLVHRHLVITLAPVVSIVQRISDLDALADVSHSYLWARSLLLASIGYFAL